MSWPDFEALLSEAQGVPVLRTSGDVILAVAPRFQAALKKAVEAVERTESAKRVLVLDLSETEFMDSVGLGTLVASTDGFRKRGGEVRLVLPPGGMVRRIVEVTGVVELFRVYPEVASAIEDRLRGA
ncbi:MAG TPA: STAS domain-containing protein [Rubrobacteraceae bacterium]|nr:STAS domain-containing protein [Rubrobacteraceae bacterium]